MVVETSKEIPPINTEIPVNGDPILNLKTEVAQKYVDDLKNKAGLGASLVIGKGEKLKNFLVTKEDGDNLTNTAGLNFMANLLNKLETKTFALDGQEYDIKNYLLRVKNKINISTEDQLNTLKINIDTPTAQVNTPTTTPTASPDTPVVPSSVSYEKFKIGNDVTAEEMNYVNDNAKYIIDQLVTKGDLTNVADIKDKAGNIVLKCRGESPYINAKAAKDLVGLSLLFYKKAGKAFLLESTYRTIEHQKRLVVQNKESGVPTAEPGYSGHNMGYSLDVSDESRYAPKIGWVVWLKKLAEMFDFHPIASEDWHFDYSEFVNNYYKDKSARLPIAQKMQEEFTDYNLKQVA